MTNSSLSHLSPEQRSLLLEQLRTARSAQPSPVEELTALPREGAHYPLSFAQERLWFLHQFAPHDTSYVVPLAFRLVGPCSPRMLEQGLNVIISRHEILRTTFTLAHDLPMQMIAPSLHLALPVINLRSFAEAERQVLAREQLAHIARQPFDLEQGPLLRALLIQEDDEAWIFALVMHHIICDGSSGAILFRELTALYQALAQGKTADLPLLPVQYVDYARWQRQRLPEERMATHLAYWKQQLRGELPSLAVSLPTLQASSSALKPTGRAHMDLSAHLRTQLQALGQREGATLFMVLMAAFQLLLVRSTGQTDIVVGTPMVNRPHAKLQHLIGLFLNTLVLRTDCSGNPGFQELLKRVRTTCLEAYAHQDLPFEKIVEALQPARHLDQTPFFQFFFSFEQGAPLPATLADATLEPVEVANGMEKFDLTWAVEEKGEGLHVTVGYNANLFASATITQMLKHFQALLENIVAHPQQRLSDLSLLSAAERLQLLEQWSVTTTTPVSATCIHTLIEEQVARTPDAIAVFDTQAHLSYACLNRRANQLAHLLRTRGVKPDDLIGLCLERTGDLLVGLLGILKAGGAYVPLDSTHPEERLAFVLADAGIKTLVTQQDLLHHFALPALNLLCLDSDEATIAQQPPANPQAPVKTDHRAYVIYTSGSTGQPKGVQITHRAVINFLQSMHQCPGLDAQDILFSVTTLAFDIAGLELFLPLVVGARVAIAGSEITTSGQALLTRLDETQATLMQATPITWRLLIDAGWPGTPHLNILCGGESLPLDLAQQLLGRGQALYNMFGPTETTIWSTCQQIDKDATSISIGRPIANTSVYVLDDNGQPVPAGIPGELYIGGSGVARGYLHRPDLTAERFLPDPFSKQPGQRFYRTGDRVRYRADGSLEYLGRKDEQVKLRGYRIELTEIESVLKRHAGVKDAAVVIEDDANGEKQLVAYVIPHTQTVSSEDLYSFLLIHLPLYMVPALFVTLERFPITPNGKLDRRGLRAIARPLPRGETTYSVPRTEQEAQLARIWEEILGVARVGIDDNFFLLGGHSLKAIQVISRFHEVAGIQLSLRQLFACPTIRMLRQPLEQARQEVHSDIAHLPQRQSYELSPAQLRFWLIQQIDPTSTAYTILHRIPCEFPIDYACLKQALLQVIDRHESLRTAFRLVEQQPAQLIEPVPRHILSVVDLRPFSDEERDHLLADLRHAALQTRFDLQTAPLLRAVFCRTGEEAGELHLILHHIICDGWSLEVLQRDLLNCYQAYWQQREPALPALSIHYKDYAAWQNSQLTSPIMQEHQRFWQRYLQPPLPALTLPGDYEHEGSESRLGSGYRFILTGEEYARIKEMAIQQQASLFMVCVAVLTIWLADLTGQSDILIAAPLAGREHSATHALVGLFLNTVLLRNQVQRHDTFSELLQRVRMSTLEAMEHQAYPFEKLLEEIEVTRQIGRFPLTPVLFNMLNFPRERVAEISQEETGLYELHLEVKSDLNFHINEYSDGLDITCHYRQGLFQPATIVYLLNAYRQALIDVARNPALRVQDLAVFPSQALPIYPEQATMDETYAHLLTGTIFAHFQQQVQRRPQALAVVTEQDSATYAQLSARALRIAQAIRLQARSDEVSLRVALLFTPGVEMIAAMLGVLRAGGAFIALDPAYPFARLLTLFQDSQPALLLTDTPSAQKAWQLCEQSPLPCLNVHELANATVNPDMPQENPEKLAYILYTSGSTGTPKGVMQTQQNVLHFIASYSLALHLQPEDRLTLLSSYAFDGAIMDIFGALLNGCTLYPLRLLEQEVFADIWTWLREQQITIWHSIPAVYRALLHSQPSPHAQQALALRQVVLGGEEVRARDVRAHLQSCNGHIPLMNLYGQSESSLSTYAMYDNRWQNERITLGQPVAETEVAVLTEDGCPARIYEEGELVIRSPYISPGYWPAGQADAAPVSPGTCRSYHSGDLVRLLPGGHLQFTGRKDFQVKIRGHRVEIAEIEKALLESSLVQEAAVQKQFIAGEEQLVAYLVAREAGKGNSTLLRSTLAQTLPSFMLPARFLWLATLPKTPGGKLDRAALPAAQAEQDDEEEQPVLPATPLEEKLALLWQSLLGKHPLSIHANFFALGGHSLLVIQLHTRIKESLGIHLSLRKLFEHPTIAEQAIALIEAQLATLEELDLERLLHELEQD